MLQKNHIEKFLQLNGLAPDSPDDEIRSLLISARWHENDIDAALVVLRENPKNQLPYVKAVHKTFRGNQKLSPDAINSLLGLSVEVKEIATDHHVKLQGRYRMQVLSIIVLSIIAAAAVLVAAMWFMEAGIFHEQALSIGS